MESKELDESALAVPEKQLSGHTECTICFEALDSKGGAIPLPCDCRVPYCADCWDRALAASISACGRALCPSCRGFMRVDFDAPLGRLKFSRAPGSELGPDAPDDNWRKRLYAQAMPKQIQLLERLGAERAALAQSEGSAGVGGSFGSSQAATTSPAAEHLLCYQTHQPARCVCGSALAEVSVRDRVLTFVQEESPITPPSSVIKHLMMSPPIVCDLCGRRLRPAGKVWTCENGRRTVLHAAAYDVCESCFSFYVYGIEDAADREDSVEYDEYGSDGVDIGEFLADGSDDEGEDPRNGEL